MEIVNGERVHFSAQGPDATAAVKRLAAFLAELREAPAAAHSPPTPLEQLQVSTIQPPGGIGISSGIAVGRVQKIQASTLNIEATHTTATQPPKKRSKLHSAIFTSLNELKTLSEKSKLKSCFTGSNLCRPSGAVGRSRHPGGHSSGINAGLSAAAAWDKTIRTHSERWPISKMS